ncbi:MAG: SUMF1/EgtB/PvdO family nonheme iron enzyme [Snowella sp.]|nr:SUMF1/EgtB/PvdO family nonheme iron enzyme [Snowella sp.]
MEFTSEPSKSPSQNDESLGVHNTSLSDQATVDDSLGFKPYVTAIAEFLLNPDTKPPLTLSVEGEWGSGKSSFMKQLDKYLREKELDQYLQEKKNRKEPKHKQRTVWFNAWRHDKAEAVWAAFALSFIKQITIPQTVTWKEYREKYQNSNRQTYWVYILQAHYDIFKGHVRLAISRFDLKKGWLELFQVGFILLFVFCSVIAIPLILLIYGLEGLTQLIRGLKNPDQIVQAVLYVLGIAGGGSISVAGLLTLLKKIPSIIGNPKFNLIKYLKSPDYNKQSAFIEEFHEDFTKIVDAYIGDGKVFVFIDDLDRCEHPKAADLMQAINLMIADDPSVVFILGMDREKVAAGLAVKYEQILNYLPSETQEIDPEILAQRNLDKGLAYGYSFIEKFVQLPFQVPQPSLTDFDNLFEQLKASKIQPSLPTIKPKKESKWTLPKFIRLKDENQSSQATQVTKQESIVTDVNQPIFQSEASSTPSPTQKRLETLRVEFGQDSPLVRDMIRMVAPFFNYNPRRIKQFLNLFRLKVYIADLTGLFDRIEDDEGNIIQEPLTAFQLAKFTAVSLKYPLFLLDLKNDYDLLKRIHYSREYFPPNFETHDIPKENPCSKKWQRNHPQLTQLVISECWSEFDLQVMSPTEYLPANPQFSLAKLEVEKLLKISPQVIRSNSQASPVQQQVKGPNIEFSTPELAISSPDQQAIIKQILSQMVDIPAGSFLMGSDENETEQPMHEVYVNAFQIGKYPVTQEQYRAIMDNNPSSFRDNPNNPVENVSWDDAKAFCQKLKELTGKDFRLPTEAEWEYACRAGTQTRYCFGDEENQLWKYAWYKENSDSKTHPVGQKKPNNWGLYDMHGNVLEWCEDACHESYAGKPDNLKSNGNTAWLNSDKSRRVLRGGSWKDYSGDCRSAVRCWILADIGIDSFGFRLILSSF